MSDWNDGVLVWKREQRFRSRVTPFVRFHHPASIKPRKLQYVEKLKKETTIST